MNIYSDISVVQTALYNLANENSRERSANILKEHVENAARELSLENFSKFENELYHNIFSLVQSELISEKLGGIKALRVLITCSSASAEQKVNKFAGIISIALKSNTNFEVLESLADTLGHMAKYAPVSNSDYVQSELSRALEWLKLSVSHRRFAACAVLHQLAENAPTIFFVRSKDYFDSIWGPLRDKTDAIRIIAAKSLSSCLSVLKQRTYHLEWYSCIYEQILIGFQQGTSESIHGSLLVVGEMLAHSGDYMLPRYKEISKSVLATKDRKSKTVKASLIRLIPQLAEYCKDAFVRLYLDDSIDILIKCTKVSELRAVSLLSIGKLCRSTGSELTYRTEELVELVRDVLMGSHKRVKDIPPEALICISDMVCGLGVSFHFQVLGLLDSMLQAGLTQELIETLAVIASNMPMHKEIIHNRLLEEIIKVLGGVTIGLSNSSIGNTQKSSGYSLWSKLGSNNEKKDTTSLVKNAKSTSHKSFGLQVDQQFWFANPNSLKDNSQYSTTTVSNPEIVLLAMRTLRMLTTTNCGFLILVENYVLPFLRTDNVRIREEAAVTATKLLEPIAFKCHLTGPSSAKLESILQQILEVMVTDQNANVRMKILESLGSNFDKYLSQVHHLNTILFLVADENFAIRLAAVSLLGKLSLVNPSAILPAMRQVFQNIIDELQCAADVKVKEEAVLLLCAFLRSFGFRQLVRPFVGTLINVLPLSSDVRLATAALEALGELSSVIPQDLLRYTSSLFPLIITHVYDRSSRRKQEMAMKTLGQLISASYALSGPYLNHLPYMLSMLAKGDDTIPWSLKFEVLKTIGLLGSLDPRKYLLIANNKSILPPRKVTEDLSQPESRSRQNSVADLAAVVDKIDTPSSVLLSNAQPESLFNDDSDTPSWKIMYEMAVMSAASSEQNSDNLKLTPLNEAYYPQVAITALMKVLNDSTLNNFHPSVTQAVLTIFKFLGLRSVPFLDQVVPHVFQIFRKCGHGLRESILHQITQLATIVKSHLSKYVLELITITTEFWTQHLDHLVLLLENIATHLPDEFRKYTTNVTALLLSNLVIHKDTHATSTFLEPKGSSKSSTLIVTSASSTNVNGTADIGLSRLPHTKLLERTMSCIDSLRSHLRCHLHLIIPALCKLIAKIMEANGIQNSKLLVLSVKTLHRVVAQDVVLDTPQIASRAILCVLDVMTKVKSSNSNSEVSSTIQNECTNAVCCFTRQLGYQSLAFTRSIKSTFQSCGIVSKEFDTIVSSLNQKSLGSIRIGSISSLHSSNEELNTFNASLNESYLEANNLYADNFRLVNESAFVFTGNSHGDIPKQTINQQHLQRAWDVSQQSTTADWDEWFRRVSIEMLRESPSPSLRACSALSQAYAPLARELFNAAFVCCWSELSEQYKGNIIMSLHLAFHSSTIPAEILQVLLNLAEFMEHEVEALPIDPKILADLAQRCHAYAKALYYQELKFRTSPASCYESLITINKKLNHYDSANGVLRLVQRMQTKNPELGMNVHVSWLAKLGRFDEALQIYSESLEQDPKNIPNLVGKIKCSHALGNWEEALRLCTDNIEYIENAANCSKDQPKHQIYLIKSAVIGARSAWVLHEWDVMDSLVKRLPHDNIDGSVMRAVLAANGEEYSTSSLYIEHARKLVGDVLAALMSESYNRAYHALVTAQQLSELEEIIEYKQLLRQAGMSTNSKEYSWTLNEERPKQVEELSTPGVRRAFGLVGSTSNEYDEMGAVGSGASDLSKRAYIAEVTKKKSYLIEKWKCRLHNCSKSGKAAQYYWQKLLDVRRIIVTEREDIDVWLEYVSLCRHEGHLALADRILGFGHRNLSRHSTLSVGSYEDFVSTRAYPGLQISIPVVPTIPTGAMSPNPYSHSSLTSASSYAAFPAMSPMGPVNVSMGRDTSVDSGTLAIDCRIQFEYLRQKWAQGQKQEATQDLSSLVNYIGSRSTLSVAQSQLDLSKLHHDCLIKLALWKMKLLDPALPVDAATRQEVTQIYHTATQVNPQSYNAWHEWGLANYNSVQETKARNTARLSNANANRVILSRRPSIPPESLHPLVINALKGLSRAICLGARKWSPSVMHDLLAIMRCWFKYGEVPEIAEVIDSGLNNIPLDNWLGVIPQLIARIHHQGEKARTSLHNLLSRLGKEHAQALLYPLSVALQSQRLDRKQAAESLMNNLSLHSATLIQQSLMVSEELIRTAIIWEEFWHELLETSSKLYFGDGNIQAMLDQLLPWHEKLNSPPQTQHEAIFNQTYGGELREAHNTLKNYIKIMASNNKIIPTSGAQPSNMRNRSNLGLEEQMLATAWDYYYSVFKKINAQLPQVLSLDLRHVSPALLNANNMDLAVPGTYTANGKAVRIGSFNRTVTVIRSKQRPRKITIIGQNGEEYVFLLKGHEDLRQDERAMQFFGLINALMKYERHTENYDLSIQRYAVIPLSPNCGLVGWVPSCDTLHDLIRSYRESKNVALNIEQKLMQQLAPNNMYDSLTAIQKIEVFNHALSNTPGDDLHKILWYHSTTSESWLIRRDEYTKSTAVMSVVGYVLGLGDRHPSNLMLRRNTGKLFHIDFGDCFEVAKHRDKYPEKIPFRLTRMLVKAMEVCGVEGTYRLTSERVMKVLRENRDSLIAILEAFVHDPLISWRLLNPNRSKGELGPEANVPHRRQDSASTVTTISEDAQVTPPLVSPLARHCPNDTESQGHASRRNSKTGSGSKLQSLQELKEIRSGELHRIPESPGGPVQITTVFAKDDKKLEEDPIVEDQNIFEKHNNNTDDVRKMSSESPLEAESPPKGFDNKKSSFNSNLHLDMKNLSDSLLEKRMSYGFSEGRHASHNMRYRCDTLLNSDGLDAPDEELTEKAVAVIQRVSDKLTGLDFADNHSSSGHSKALQISEQIDRLIDQATACENLSACYFGWCAFW